MEINADGEGDEENGDVRCPHCRRSFIEGDLHKRRNVIRSHALDISAQCVEDIVTLEDVISRVMQLCAYSEHGVSYFNVEPRLVAHAISRDATYTATLERVMGSARRARQLRLSIVRSQPDKAHIRALCKEYMSQLTKVAGRTAQEAQRILEEVAQQSLSNVSNHERYRSAWQRHIQAVSPKKRELVAKTGGHDSAAPAIRVTRRRVKTDEK